TGLGGGTLAVRIEHIAVVLGCHLHRVRDGDVQERRERFHHPSKLRSLLPWPLAAAYEATTIAVEMVWVDGQRLLLVVLARALLMNAVRTGDFEWLVTDRQMVVRQRQSQVEHGLYLTTSPTAPTE